MKRTYLFIIMLALVMGASGSALGQASFFGEEDLNQRSASLNQAEKDAIELATDREERQIRKFRSKGVKRVLRYRFARVNREAILSDSVVFNFFSGRTVKIKTKSVERFAASDLVNDSHIQWKGEYDWIDEKKSCYVAFSDTTKRIEFDWPSYVYDHYSKEAGAVLWAVKVTSLSDRVCMIEEINPHLTVGCGLMNRESKVNLNEQYSINRKERMITDEKLESQNAEDSIKVLVCYTNSAYSYINSNNGNIVSNIVSWVNAANAAFNNNQVSTKIKLVRTAMVYYKGDESEYSKILDSLTNPNDGVLDEIPRLRNAYAADFVVLVLNDAEAAGVLGINDGKTKLQGAQLNGEYAYSVVWNTPDDNFTFAHEIGHLRGSDHQAGISGYSYPSPYQTARAFLYGTSWRTVMSVKTSTSMGPRISYYSSPSRFYQSLPVGAFNANNESALNLTSQQNLSYRTGSVLKMANDTIRNKEIAIASATTSIDTDNKVVAALNGSDVRFVAGTKVTLKPGFRSWTGSKFVAKIGTGSTASEAISVPPAVSSARSATAAEEEPETPHAQRSATESTQPSVPTEFSLAQNYPNPFNPTTKIRYALPRSAKVSLAIYDVLGRRVMELVNEGKAAGYYEVSVNAGRLSSGTYFYRLQAGEYVETKKMVVVK